MQRNHFKEDFDAEFEQAVKIAAKRIGVGVLWATVFLIIILLAGL